MKHALPSLPALLFAFLFAFAVGHSPSATGQQGARVRVRFTDFDIETVDSPQYELLGEGSRIKNRFNWTRFIITYETRGGEDGWIDNLQLNWNVMLLNGETPRLLMKKNIAYSDIAEERDEHQAVLYLRPRIVRRHYDEDGTLDEGDILVHVEATVDGRVVAEHNYAKRGARVPERWWTFGAPQVNPIADALLSRMETPFAPLHYDEYEYIKPEAR